MPTIGELPEPDVLDVVTSAFSQASFDVDGGYGFRG